MNMKKTIAFYIENRMTENLVDKIFVSRIGILKVTKVDSAYFYFELLSGYDGVLDLDEIGESECYPFDRVDWKCKHNHTNHSIINISLDNWFETDDNGLFNTVKHLIYELNDLKLKIANNIFTKYMDCKG